MLEKLRRNPEAKEHHLKFIPFDRTFAVAKNSEGVVCALLCATALEAFINDFAGWYSFASKHLHQYGEDDYPVKNYLKADEREILNTLNKNERLTTLEKFQIIYKFDKSNVVFQDATTLIKIRNSLAHIKSEELNI